MKLSDAIILGSTMINRMDPRTYLSQDEGGYYGCAIGMGCLAAGAAEGTMPHAKAELFPWLQGMNPKNEKNYDQEISSMFYDCCPDEPRYNGMTIEQLADYVRTIEPECGKCNQFRCSCVAEEKITASASYTVAS